MCIRDRSLAPYAVWAAGAKDSVTSVDERAATFVTRVHLNAAVGFVPTGGGAGDGGGGDGAAATAAHTNSGLRASGAAWRRIQVGAGACCLGAAPQREQAAAWPRAGAAGGA